MRSSRHEDKRLVEVSAYTWEQLAAATLRRQFPEVPGRGRAAVVELVRRVGPIQSQVARAPFVTVAARLPGASYDDITAAYEAYDLVRGSNLRGTVHTCTREQHPVLDAVTRRALANLWRRSLTLERVSVERCRAEMERFATGRWRGPGQLREHLSSWLASVESAASAEASRTSGVGRAMAHSHSALIRRPTTGGWDRQTQPGYRVAADVWGVPSSPLLTDGDAALVALTRMHLAAYGPANRRDIAWWSGAGLRGIDMALLALADELSERPGPDGQPYYDLVEAPTGGYEDPGLRLLPEYDALVVGYDPTSRDRFLDHDHLRFFWLMANGSFSSAVLHNGRLAASWKFAGSGSSRRIELRMFPGRPRLDESDLADQVAAVETALDMHVADLVVTRG